MFDFDLPKIDHNDYVEQEVERLNGFIERDEMELEQLAAKVEPILAFARKAKKRYDLKAAHVDRRAKVIKREISELEKNLLEDGPAEPVSVSLSVIIPNEQREADEPNDSVLP